MSELLIEQFTRLLEAVPRDNPWPTLVESGFLDLMRSEQDGGAGLTMDELFPFALEIGRHPDLPPVLEAMAARIMDAQTIDPGTIARPLAALLAAGQMVGAMLEAQRLTIDYAQMRKQFGREIGKFQAVQHQVVVMAEEILAARIAAQSAFVGSPLSLSLERVAVAKIRTGQAAIIVCSVAHAIHGAIGISQEHELHRHTKRLREWRFLHGGEAWWARQLGKWAISEPRDFTTLARTL